MPSDVLEINTMKQIVWDMVRADEYVKEHLSKDSNSLPRTLHVQQHKRVLALHKTNAEVFFKSYRYYQQNPALHKQLYDSVQAVANRQSRNIAGKIVY